MLLWMILFYWLLCVIRVQFTTPTIFGVSEHVRLHRAYNVLLTWQFTQPAYFYRNKFSWPLTVKTKWRVSLLPLLYYFIRNNSLLELYTTVWKVPSTKHLIIHYGPSRKLSVFCGFWTVGALRRTVCDLRLYGSSYEENLACADKIKHRDYLLLMKQARDTVYYVSNSSTTYYSYLLKLKGTN